MEPQEILEEIQTVGLWETISPYVFALLFVIIGTLVARFLARGVERFILRHRTPHTAVLFNKLVFYTLFVTIILGTLSYLGIKLTGLLAAAGILTVALAFAAQTSVSNVISGIFLYFDRPFSINDTVKIDTVLGTVTSIDLLSSRVRTFDNLMVRLPNETLLKSQITNYSLFSIRRIEIPVGVAYGTDLNYCTEVLMEAMAFHVMVMDEPAPIVLVETLGADGVNLLVRAWIDRLEFVQAKSSLTQTIYEALLAAEIEIPWPQRVVHVRREQDLSQTQHKQDKQDRHLRQDSSEPEPVEDPTGHMP